MGSLIGVIAGLFVTFVLYASIIGLLASGFSQVTGASFTTSIILVVIAGIICVIQEAFK
jgi:uncharacterized membrane protein required for colicin V production